MESIVASKGPLNVPRTVTIVSLAILVGTELFGLALAAGWAIAGLFELHLVFGPHIDKVLMALFCLLGMWGMVRFMQNAVKVEPIRD